MFPPLLVCSHDFIGEFSTSYRELSRGQSQFNMYEVSVCVCVYRTESVLISKPPIEIVGNISGSHAGLQIQFNLFSSSIKYYVKAALKH